VIKNPAYGRILSFMNIPIAEEIQATRIKGTDRDYPGSTTGVNRKEIKRRFGIS
jgi:hypothetical protein